MNTLMIAQVEVNVYGTAQCESVFVDLRNELVDQAGLLINVSRFNTTGGHVCLSGCVKVPMSPSAFVAWVRDIVDVADPTRPKMNITLEPTRFFFEWEEGT